MYGPQVTSTPANMPEKGLSPDQLEVIDAEMYGIGEIRFEGLSPDETDQLEKRREFEDCGQCRGKRLIISSGTQGGPTSDLRPVSTFRLQHPRPIEYRKCPPGWTTDRLAHDRHPIPDSRRYHGQKHLASSQRYFHC